MKKIVKQEVRNRWFFMETKAILGRQGGEDNLRFWIPHAVFISEIL